ncbi:MAG TPA: SPFH domain-containing protein [Candidatus Omnitrophota bacterium]|nr:SPFH domain-containing protein [Candidatus Omnitrophota bacterium]
MAVGFIIKLAIFAVVGIIGVMLFFHTLSWKKIEGNQAAVRQGLTRGVVEDVWLSGTHFFCGWMQDIYVYNIGTQKCTFDEKDTADLTCAPQFQRIVVDCGENGGQKAYIAMSINYRLGWDTDSNGSPVFSPQKLVKFHKDGLRENYETIILKRTVVDVVNKIARPHQALDIYSGKGFVDFKEAVDKELKNHHVFRDRGIFIENTIIYKVYLDPKYEQEIAEKVLAIQTTLKKQQQTLAAEEEARRVFAESQAKVESRKQEAEAKKIEEIKQAEAMKQKEILQAEAEKQKRILEAEGNRDANLAMASGILAVGKAEAEVQMLKREALYGGEAGTRRAQVEIATAQAEKLKGVFSGVQIVPERTILNVGKSALAINAGGKDE